MKRRIILPAAVLLMLSGTLRACDAAPPAGSPWEMTFSDEFTGKTLDGDKWTARHSVTGYFAALRPENAEVKDGVCRLVTRKEKYRGKEWTAARLSAKDFHQKYGYFEVRMKIAAVTGMINTFWLMTNYSETGVQHFFLDVARLFYPKTYDTRFGDHVRGRWRVDSQRWAAPVDLSKDYHLYALEWNDKELIWYFDGREVRRLPHTACRHPAGLHLLTVVTTPPKEIADALDGAALEMDYVRVYKKLQRPPDWSEWHDGIQ